MTSHVKKKIQSCLLLCQSTENSFFKKMVLTVIVKTIMLFEHKLLIERCFTESYSRSAFSKKGKNRTSTLFANKTIIKQANALKPF